MTCSILPREDEDRVEAFLERQGGAFITRPATERPELAPWLTPQGYLRLTPAGAQTDGFFVAVLERAR